MFITKIPRANPIKGEQLAPIVFKLPIDSTISLP